MDIEPSPAEFAAPQTLKRVHIALPDGHMAGIAIGDDTRPVDIVFLHANGLNARAYRSLLAPLGERFHVLALDLRGHGLTDLPTRRFGYASWTRHRDDVIAALDAHCGGAAVTLAGHSLGATTALLIAGKRGDLVRGLALVEPVILPASLYAMTQMSGAPLLIERTMPVARAARHRREKFASHGAAITGLTGRGIFKSFSPEALEDYVGDGFVADGKGVRLACKPEWEAATYAAQRHDPWRALARSDGPLTLLRAEHHSTMSPAAARRVARMRPDARIATVDGASHMLPFERPDRARAAIEAAAFMAAPRRYHDIV